MKEASNRRYFTERIDKDIVLPNLIEIQLDSYRWFLEKADDDFQGIVMNQSVDKVNIFDDFDA